MWTRRLKKTKMERQRRIFFFFGGNANERAQEIDDGTTGCFLGGNMDEKAQENEDETIKSKKERLEGVCERSSACSVFFFFVSNKTVVKLHGNGSSALFLEANAMAVRFYRSASVSPNPDDKCLFSQRKAEESDRLNLSFLCNASKFVCCTLPLVKLSQFRCCERGCTYWFRH